MDKLVFEIRQAEDPSRDSPGRLDGNALDLRGTGQRPTMRSFARGALTWPKEGILINEQHNRAKPRYSESNPI